jgi:aminoglycoside phosphotransferase (APT) family kinase protein
VTLPHGISNNVEGWLEANISGATAPFAYTQIAGGHSNLTFKVDDAAGHSYVLRRPPLGHRLASAHDMSREHRIIAGLANSNVPVATARGLCTDEAINELPFYVMDFVDGHVVRDKATAETLLGPDGCKQASESIVDTMAAIHAVSPEAVGLGDLGRHEGYIARQQDEVDRHLAQDTLEIPTDLDFGAVTSLSIEVRQKLKTHRPETIGQASRISGVTPAAISLLLIHLKRHQYGKAA